jgi:hypothetical protein
MDRVVHYKPRIMQQSLSSRVKNRMSMMNERHAHGSSTVQILNPFETPKLNEFLTAEPKPDGAQSAGNCGQELTQTLDISRFAQQSINLY